MFINSQITQTTTGITDKHHIHQYASQLHSESQERTHTHYIISSSETQTITFQHYHIPFSAMCTMYSNKSIYKQQQT